MHILSTQEMKDKLFHNFGIIVEEIEPSKWQARHTGLLWFSKVGRTEDECVHLAWEEIQQMK
jgi:hypothetical protein